MKQYIGTKIINAKPMNRLDYNVFRGWELPLDENGFDDGYLVEYLDGGKPNTPEYSGYVSWSPKEQFDNAYKASGNLSFGDAIAYLKKGYKVARAGWNGKGMYLVLMDGYINITANTMTRKKHNLVLNERVTIAPYIVMKTAQQTLQPGWLASQSDILSADWMIIEN